MVTGLRDCVSSTYNVYSCIVLDLVESTIQKDERREREDSQVKSVRGKFTTYSKNVALSLIKKYRADARSISAYLGYLERALSGLPLLTRVELEVTTPLVVHVRSPYMPLEIGLAWHPFFNAPYIPATTLRGALRAAAPAGVCGRSSEELFGHKKAAGLLIVTDALPVSEEVLGADVITPHYREPDAVEEHKVRPTPIVFPVVKPGAKFVFFLASEEDSLVRCMGDLLRVVDAALERGIGAKTRVGYSRAKRV